MKSELGDVVSNWQRRWSVPVLFSAVFLASLLGIFTRQLDSPAVFWVANAILLGLMLRYPGLSTLPGWLAAIVGYVAADVLTGSGWPKALWLTAGNLVGVGSAFFLFSKFSRRVLNLQRFDAMLQMIVLTLCASLASGMMGAVINPLIFGGSIGDGFNHWLVAEWFSYLAILPVILAAPSRASLPRVQHIREIVAPAKLAPLLTLLFSLGVAILLGGPGSVSYAMPALLWCALSYSVFQTALLTLFFCVLTLLAISHGYLDLAMNLDDAGDMVSLRLGILLMALGPLTVSSVMASRDSLQQRLRYMASHDSLTQVLNRGGFMDRANDTLILQQQDGSPSLAMLMLDVDHFKRINDDHGHAAGDRALAVFSTTVRRCLRDRDLLGRLGGEEFAILLPRCDEHLAMTVAERIRAAVESDRILLESQMLLRMTVSIGIAVAPSTQASLNDLLSAADAALYHAKSGGRNRVVSNLPQVNAGQAIT